MALWQIIDTQNGSLEDRFDDGLTTKPGEAGFTTDLVRQYAGEGNFNYIGTPNWVAPADPADDHAGPAE